MYSSWYPAPGNGSILLRHDFGKHGYAVQITDLRCLFEERLPEDGILKRASQSECSVDPSDDAKQFSFLLKKLQAALEGDKGTTLALPDVSSESNPTALDITITSVLPHGIPDLAWTFNLRKTQSDTLKSDVIAPLLGLVCTEQQRIAQLVNIIREKDTVITRILDKFDSTGLDFANIFPTAGIVKYRKGNQTESFRKAVKGLAEFDETDWQKQSLEVKDKIASTLTADTIGRSLKLLDRPAVLTNTNHIIEGDIQVSKQEVVEKKESPPPRKLNSQNSTISNDGFQRQTPPPKESADQETPSPLEDPRSRTVREESAKKNSADKPMATSRRKLGALGGGASVTDQEPPLTRLIEDSATDSPSPEAGANIPIAQSQAKLGQRGGQMPHAEPELTDTTDESQEEPLPKPRRGKLGQLGGRREKGEKLPAESVSAADEEPHASSRIKQESQSDNNEAMAQSTSRSDRPVEPPEDVEEDPTEKANRRREELKRQMEEKTKAQTKKKRRF